MHPKYLDAFVAVHEFLMTGDGPLPTTDRHHIALMACSRHFCDELMKDQEAELHDCSPQTSSSDMKPKLRRLNKINKLLAHRPWMIKKHHIKELTQGDEKEGGASKWLLSELVAAIIILCHFQALSSFVLGCGTINRPSADHKEVEAVNDVEAAEVTNRADHVPAILKRMEVLKSQPEELELAELARRFDTIKVEDQEIVPPKIEITRSRSTTPSTNEIEEAVAEAHILDASKYTDELDFQYVDFVKRENHTDYPTFRESEFSWADHAFYTVTRFNGDDMGTVIDNKFSVITGLTYMTIGRYESVDTKLFRLAVQRYIQCLFGIRHDDYDYGQINELLPRRLKKYIKTICCYPERSTVDEYESIMADFRNSEKVHVCMLVCEARFQAGLLYSMRAVSEYYNHE